MDDGMTDGAEDQACERTPATGPDDERPGFGRGVDQGARSRGVLDPDRHGQGRMRCSEPVRR